jgi:4-hydroxy-2-oxoglutarate aldolase
MPPLTTPFDERGDVDYAALRRNLERYSETGLSGYVALGSNGEAVHLSIEERGKVIDSIKRGAASAQTVVAGVNELSTRAAVESSKRAADAGADAVLVITPYFYKGAMTQEALVRHFTEVADSSPVPLLIYNVPQNTGVVIDSVTLARLADHQNIIGVKDSAGNFGAISETIRLTPARFSVMCGNGGILYPALEMGAAGAVLAVACAAPRACVELFLAVKNGDHETARRMQNRLAPVSHAVTAGFGVAGLKAAMELAGYEGGAVRAPLLQLGGPDLDKLGSILRSSGLFPGMK